MMRRVHLIVTIVAAFSQLLAYGQGTGQRPFTFEDMMSLKRISGPQISPDGKWVLFSAVDVSLKENKKTPHLWVVPVAGGESRQITPGPAGEDRGRWSPDGQQLSFVSSRDGSSQIWVASFDSSSAQTSGEPRKVTSISTEADGAMWSPDGKNILFTSEVYPDCPDDACKTARDYHRLASKVKA